MYKPYRTPTSRAFPNIKVREPRISKFVIVLCRLLGRLYLFIFFGVARIVLQGDRFLIEAFRRAMAGESRCIVAFRHPNGGEPQLLAWFFLFKLRGLAAKKGIRFARWPHAVFVYGYEVVRWGGWVARFIMPNVGAMPIHHSKMDSKGMARIYNAITEGPYPLALAPEGQVSYTTDDVPRLEPGVIRIGFNAAERLAAKNAAAEYASCPVEILPVSVHFRFGSWGRLTLEPLLRKIERVCGIPFRGRVKIPLLERLRQCRDYILAVNEERYAVEAGGPENGTVEREPAASVEAASKETPSAELPPAEPPPFEVRLERVMYAALETAERMMSVKNEGDFFARMYRTRQLYWDRIYLPDTENFDGIPPIKRNIMDLTAGESWYIGRHIEFLDFCWYFRIPLPAEDAPFHRKIEYAQNLWDFASRTMGGAFKNRINIFPRKVIIQAAPVINLSERLPAYRQNRKAAAADALSDLEQAFRGCIREANGL